MKTFTVAALTAIASAQQGRISIDPSARMFVDEAGRTVLFHGVNAVYKVPPYIPTMTGPWTPNDSLNAQDIQYMKDWGFNFVRLGVMWEAVERVAGQYDDAYLDQVEVLINELGAAGIYTLVDMHQDVFARSICGEGFPDFYAQEVVGSDPVCISKWIDPMLQGIYDKIGLCEKISSFGFQYDSNGDPLISNCQTVDFYKYYETANSIVAFEALYRNKQSIQDKFLAYWDKVSARFGTNPFVVGFDPLNEPFPGNFLRNPKLLEPGHADQINLAPMYTTFQEKYMANSNGTSKMWFEPNVFPDEVGVPIGEGDLGGVVFPVGFQTPPGGEIGSPNHVLNDHTYCCQLTPSMCATGEPRMDKAEACYKWHEDRLGQRTEDAKRLGVPFALTEFGACLTEGPCTQEITQVAQVADHYLASWAYWQYKYYGDLTTSAGTGSEGFWNSDGTLQEWKVKALARTYLKATQGVPLIQNFNHNTGEFFAKLDIDPAIGAPTVIYTSTDYWYPTGYTVEIADTFTDHVLTAKQVHIDRSDPRNLQFQVVDKFVKQVTVQITAI